MRTWYKGIWFRSRLAARWAAFFDLAGWAWVHTPPGPPGWVPDFRVEFPCGHSECSGSHVLLVEVQPFDSLRQFDGHPGLEYPYGSKWDEEAHIPADASAAFGNNPDVTQWEMGHGAGGGEEKVENWIGGMDARDLWDEADRLVRSAPEGN